MRILFKSFKIRFEIKPVQIMVFFKWKVRKLKGTNHSWIFSTEIQTSQKMTRYVKELPEGFFSITTNKKKHFFLVSGLHFRSPQTIWCSETRTTITSPPTIPRCQSKPFLLWILVSSSSYLFSFTLNFSPKKAKRLTKICLIYD